MKQQRRSERMNLGCFHFGVSRWDPRGLRSGWVSSRQYPVMPYKFIMATTVAVIYFAAKYRRPVPPTVVGVDLGTTFSSIGVYHAFTDGAKIISDDLGECSIPSVVAFLSNGSVLVGHRAVQQQDKNPLRTIYDAKRFIGKIFKENDPQFHGRGYGLVRVRFCFRPTSKGIHSRSSCLRMVVPTSMYRFPIPKGVRIVTPEEVGGIIIRYLKSATEKATKTPVSQLVIAVPVEFDEEQRNATARAADFADLETRRIISEPTAAALAYGLHKKKGVEHIVVVDLGGGTLDVSVLWLQGGVFVTQAMAGKNRLGGQDFNDRVQHFLMEYIEKRYGKSVTDKEDLQQLPTITLHLKNLESFSYELTRTEFESINADLFDHIKEPIKAALEDAQITPEEVDEIVLVGGSTRIPLVRKIVESFFGQVPNYDIDPELAVVTGVSVEADAIGVDGSVKLL
ncbi:hypothetical protein L596_021403 [Steinernema carpocapsae]|uniref:Uncharacterized protein n=1 Tax=Steinernema carpocapsae TaxID=34508 RepID=A0A4U5MIL8_STECR|nr:hypothetical protein L596_021403 [Steinernema carpocapsae]